MSTNQIHYDKDRMFVSAVALVMIVAIVAVRFVL